MVIVLIHWRIKPDQDSIDEFLDFWRTKTVVQDRTGLIGEILSDSLSPRDFSYITWHLDSESFGNNKSFVNVGTWSDGDKFHEQIGQYFNDDKPMLAFEKYRRRRTVLRPRCWRMGDGKLPAHDSAGVL